MVETKVDVGPAWLEEALKESDAAAAQKARLLQAQYREELAVIKGALLDAGIVDGEAGVEIAGYRPYTGGPLLGMVKFPAVADDDGDTVCRVLVDVRFDLRQGPLLAVCWRCYRCGQMVSTEFLSLAEPLAKSRFLRFIGDSIRGRAKPSGHNICPVKKEEARTPQARLLAAITDIAEEAARNVEAGHLRREEE